ncbi:HEPN domain-containing protein [Pseudomonas sp. GNP014]
MDEARIHQKYTELLHSINEIIGVTEQRLFAGEPDKFFQDNMNFFVKAYLITICTYLESYLKDIAYCRVEVVEGKLRQVYIPSNIVHWCVSGFKDVKVPKYETLTLQIKKKDLGEQLSAQPYKTVEVFKLIGVELEKVAGFVEQKDHIKSMVNKRNNVIHHNDDASDVTLTDLRGHIDRVYLYMAAITAEVKNHNLR